MDTTLYERNDEELTAQVIQAMGWSIFEYPESIPDQDEDGSPSTSEVSFYGLKRADGTVYYKGGPFKDEIFKTVTVNSMHFMGILLGHLTNNNFIVTMTATKTSSEVSIGLVGDSSTEIIVKRGDANTLPRVLAEAFISYNKQN